MELTFTKQGKWYVAEFEITANANLHIEKEPRGEFYIYQRTTSYGEYDIVQDFGWKKGGDNIIDYDIMSLVYPKFIKIKSSVLPTLATLTSDGEVTEIVAQSKSVEVTANGSVTITPDSGFGYLSDVVVTTNVPQEGGGGTPDTPSTSWTGHADAEGLKAIGWTDEDIAYYQANGVNWNEEDDEYHKVTDDNKALYGVLTVSNIGGYKDRIVYLPKIDTSGVTNMVKMFQGYYSLVAIPQLDTSSVTDMSQMFYNCYSLTNIPQLDTSKVTNMSQMFYNCYPLTTIPQLDTSKVTDMSQMFFYCYSLTTIPQLDTSKVTNMVKMFYNCYPLTTIPQLDTSKVTNMTQMFLYCYSLTNIPQLDTSSVTNMVKMFQGCYSLTTIPQLDTSKVTNMSQMFYYCYSLTNIPQLDTSKVTDMSQMFFYCYSLTYPNLKGVTLAIPLDNASKLSKESLLYIINNEAATSAITITLHSYAYSRWAEDADVVAALANHPNISLAKA